MSDAAPQVKAAAAQAALARARLFATLDELHTRLKPATLAHDAMDSAAQGAASLARKGADAVKARPLASAAVAGTVGLVLARNWIARAFLGRHARDATPAPAAGLDKKAGRRAGTAKEQSQ
jgi:ElaB/YqjD/DUF883 family membrane-anchored ribosome-binding protein